MGGDGVLGMGSDWMGTYLATTGRELLTPVPPRVAHSCISHTTLVKLMPSCDYVCRQALGALGLGNTHVNQKIGRCQLCCNVLCCSSLDRCVNQLQQVSR